MRQALEEVMNYILEYYGGVIPILAIILSGIYLYVINREKYGKLIYGVLIAAVVVLNPISYKVILNQLDYPQILWIVPELLMIALACVELIRANKKVWESIVVAIVLAGIIACFGVNYYRNNDFILIQNAEKVIPSWNITQYGNSDTMNSMFYTVTDQYGNLVVIDGGYDRDADDVRQIIAQYDNHVSIWIITHPHPDHAGAFNVIASDPQGITIDKVYSTDVNYDRYVETAQDYDGLTTCDTYMQVIQNYDTYMLHEGESYDVLGLTMNVLHGWDASVDALPDHLCNDGSLMFTLEGNESTMLFCGDVQSEMEEEIMQSHMDILQTVDYVQTGHHGNWGLSTAFYDTMNPQIAFFDSSDALLVEDSIYDGFHLKQYFDERGIPVYNFSTTPYEFVLY